MLPFIERRAGIALLGAWILLALPKPAAANGSISTIGTDSVTLPFAGGVSNGLLIGSPALAVTLPGGVLLNPIMDTGSAGMVVTTDLYTPPAGQSPSITNVVQAYASNGVMFTGDVYNTPVLIGSGASTALATVPLLVVPNSLSTPSTPYGVQCIPNVSCTLPPNLSWKFMGVGFGETTSSTTNWGTLTTTQRNPLFNISQINGQPASPTLGWILSSTGITVGLTTANTQPFPPGNLVSLTQSGDGFNRALVRVAVNGNPSYLGSVLVDSGIEYAYLQPALADVPATVNGDPTLPSCPTSGFTCTAPGNTITIDLGSPEITYSVSVGPTGGISASPYGLAAPDFIRQIGATTNSPYWNTSFHFFNAYQYLFDAADSVVGYAPVTPVPGPLSLLGAAGAYGWSKRLRRRIRSLSVTEPVEPGLHPGRPAPTASDP